MDLVKIYTNELNVANKEGKINQGSAKFEIKGKSLIGERLEVIQLLNDPDGNGEPDYGGNHLLITESLGHQ